MSIDPLAMPVFTINDVQFYEFQDGNSGASQTGRNTGSQVANWKVRWADADRARVALLGHTEVGSVAVAGQPNKTYLKRFLPHLHPSRRKWYARSVDVEGVGVRGRDDDQVQKYEWAKLKTAYGRLPFEVVPDAQMGDVPDESQLLRYVQVTPTFQRYGITFRAGAWYWFDVNEVETAKAVTNDYEIAFVLTTFKIKWFEVPKTVVPYKAVLSMLNHVNRDPFTIEGEEYEAETLKVGEPEAERCDMPDESDAVNLTISLSHNPMGWNRLPAPHEQNFFRTIGKGAERPFQRDDFARLFQPRVGS
jgi:hypothetical protein